MGDWGVECKFTSWQSVLRIATCRPAYSIKRTPRSLPSGASQTSAPDCPGRYCGRTLIASNASSVEECYSVCEVSPSTVLPLVYTSCSVLFFPPRRRVRRATGSRPTTVQVAAASVSSAVTLPCSETISSWGLCAWCASVSGCR